MVTDSQQAKLEAMYWVLMLWNSLQQDVVNAKPSDKHKGRADKSKIKYTTGH